MKLRKSIIPFLLSLLIVVLACSMAQAYSGYYYVIPDSAPLREHPGHGSDVLHTVYKGDKVEILERSPTGWSQVRMVDRAGTGWIPSDWLSYSPDLQAKPMPTYYVNTSSLPLRDNASPRSNVITTLHFNDPVEMLGVGTSGWAQVRDLGSQQVGWVPPRYLSSSPPSQPKSSRRRRAPRKPAPEKEEAPKEAPASPKAM